MPQPPYIRSSDGVVRQGATVPPGGLPTLGLDGAELSFIRVDHQVRLHFGETAVVIETDFQLSVRDQHVALDPGQRAALGPLLGLYPATLLTALVTADLTLRLAFSGDAVVEVPQHDHYEAWEIVGPGSRLIVCPPAGAGTLAVWL